MRLFDQQNNKGMTLLELIVSMAITAIVLSMIIMFISAASNGFRRTNDEVNLQMEAQTTINQLSNMVIEAKNLKESTNAVAPNKRYILQIPTDKNTDTDSDIGTDTYAIVFIKNTSKIYLIKCNTMEEAESIAYDDSQNLLAQFVDNFSITTLNGNTASIDMDLVLGNDDYSISKKVKLRNIK